MPKTQDKRRRFRLLFTFAVIVATRVWSPAAAGTSDYTIYVVNPPINNLAIQPHLPLPSTCRVGSDLRIMACRGEYEPCSFVVETEQVLRQVTVEMDPLQGDVGVIPTSAVDIRAVVPLFYRVTDYPGFFNWVLLHDPNLVLTRAWQHPDAHKQDAGPVLKAYTKKSYFTRDPVDTANLQSADIQTRRQFWLTVHVPDTAKAGVYRTTIRIVSTNAPARQLSLELTVPSFDLSPPEFEYSVYYPSNLEGTDVGSGRGAVLTEQRYRADLLNMVAHGCTNPNIYSGPTSVADGSLDFTVFERVLALREQSGMRGKDLYILGAGAIISSGQVDAQQRANNVQLTRQLVAWIRGRGYRDVYLMGQDEATGKRLLAQREAWKSIREGGGKIYVANFAGFAAGISDLLDVPVMQHPIHMTLNKHHMMTAEKFLSFPSEIRQGMDLNRLLESRYRDGVIGRVHELGHRIFTYMDPMAGCMLPMVHRRTRGLGL